MSNSKIDDWVIYTDKNRLTVKGRAARKKKAKAEAAKVKNLAKAKAEAAQVKKNSWGTSNNDPYGKYIEI